jgi:hypothetical protein
VERRTARLDLPLGVKKHDYDYKSALELLTPPMTDCRKDSCGMSKVLNEGLGAGEC